jgi:hypothetical protein
METTPLSDADLDLMAAQVDEQLLSLRAAPVVSSRGVEGFAGEASIPDAPAQRAVVEEATGEPFETFWQKYRRHLQQDLCLPGGMLHEQWKKFQDVSSKDAVRISYVWLAAMGLPTLSIAPAAIAVTVFALNVALKLGIDVFCEDCVKEAAKKAPEKTHKYKSESPKRKKDQ